MELTATCFLVSLNKEPYLFLHNPPVLPYPLRAVRPPPPLSCPCCTPSACRCPCPILVTHRPLAAHCPCPVLIARRPLTAYRSCSVLVARRPLSVCRPHPVHSREPSLTLPHYTVHETADCLCILVAISDQDESAPGIHPHPPFLVASVRVPLSQTVAVAHEVGICTNGPPTCRTKLTPV